MISPSGRYLKQCIEDAKRRRNLANTTVAVDNLPEGTIAGIATEYTQEDANKQFGPSPVPHRATIISGGRTTVTISEDVDVHLKAHKKVLEMDIRLSIRDILDEITNIRKILEKANKPKRKKK